MRKLSHIDINEGMWKSGLDRARKNEDRLEDKLNSNIESLKTVDMGSNAGVDVLFADKDLEIDGQTSFKYDELESFIPYIEKHGWRVPSLDEMKSFFMNYLYEINARKFKTKDAVKTEVLNDKVFFEIYSTETKNYLYFPLEKSKNDAQFYYDTSHYWLLNLDLNDKKKRGVMVIAPERFSSFIIKDLYVNPIAKLKIRLVKDR